MTVHVGEVTSEVIVRDSSAAPGDGGSAPVWEEQARLSALLERIARDRCRTATGGEDG